jgi:hypothetical protein
MTAQIFDEKPFFTLRISNVIPGLTIPCHSGLVPESKNDKPRNLDSGTSPE